MKGLIHCHSENSRYDSAMNVKTLCMRAKELGYEAITLTDHGTLTGIDDFVAAANAVGIKPIPGVEAYMQEDNTSYKKFHLILLAKDDLGYQGIGKAVSESNRRIDSNGYPRMNKEILKKYFGPGRKYHDHVIATSACVGGVLAGLYLSPLEFHKEINKRKTKMEKYENPDSSGYLKNKDMLIKKETQLEDMVKFREECSLLAKKPYKKKEKSLEKFKETATDEEYKKAFVTLEAEKKETEIAIIALDDIRAKISLMKKDITAIKNKIKDSQESHEKYKAIQKEIDQIKENILPEKVIYECVLEEAKVYDEIFGHSNFYIEMQYHGYLTDDGIEEIEKKAMPQLLKIADTLSIPIVAANDAHTPDGSEKSLRARQIISSIRYAKKGFISSIRKGDDQLYVKSEEELHKALNSIISNDRADEAIKNAYTICDRCNCNFDYGTHYPKFKGIFVGETADAALRRMALAGIKRRFPDPSEWTKVYQERFEYELKVIASMGFSDYFLIVQDFLEFGRKLGHLDQESLDYLKERVKELSLDELSNYVECHQTEIGFVVGAGRGSAAGSLIAYLVGITDIIDPLKYDLLFEREKNALLKFD